MLLCQIVTLVDWSLVCHRHQKVKVEKVLHVIVVRRMYAASRAAVRGRVVSQPVL